MNLGTGTRRREFIAALGSAAATAIWPLAGRTQQNQLRRVGILMAYPEGDREGQSFITTFRGHSRSSAGRRAAMYKLMFAGRRPATPRRESGSQKNSSH